MSSYEQPKEEFSIKDYFVPLTTIKAVHFIILIGFIVFFNSLFNGFVGDDDGQIVLNIAIRSISNIPLFFFGGNFYSGDISQLTGVYYRPMVNVFYTILYLFGGGNPFPYHLFQIILHITNAILVFLIMRMFLKQGNSFFIALIFLLHPMQAEAVNYLADLQDVLFFFFGALAFYLVLKLKHSTKTLMISMLFMLLSILSKETGILFILLVLVYKILFRKRKEWLQSLIYSSLLVGSYGLFRLFFVHGMASSSNFSMIEQSPYLTRLLTVPTEILYYLKTFLFPLQLGINQVWTASMLPASYNFFSAIIVCSIFIALIIFARVLFLHHKHHFKAYIFFLIWFITGMFFHLHIVLPLDFTVADRWFYFPIVGLLGLLGIIIQVYFGQKNFFKVSALISGIVLLVIFSGITINRNTNFYNKYSLLSHDIQYSENNSYMHSALAIELINDKRFDEAYVHLQQSIKLSPKGDVNWNTLGHYYQKTGQLGKAVEAYKTSINNAPYYLSYEDLALLYFTNNNPQTKDFISNSLKKFPRDGYLWFLYSLTENKLEHKEAAIEAARYMIAYFPDGHAQLLYNLLTQNIPVTYKVQATKDGTTVFICYSEGCF